jgi:hypothetical protein
MRPRLVKVPPEPITVDPKRVDLLVGGTIARQVELGEPDRTQGE